MIISMQLEFPVAVDIGKFSPEAMRFIANRLDVLIPVASEIKERLENKR
jgi:hypothetical protein